MDDLQLKNEELVKENKKLNAELRRMVRDVAAQKRQLRIMEMSYQSRNVMYRSQINENAKQRHFLTHFMQSSQNFVIFLDEEEHIAYVSKKFLTISVWVLKIWWRVCLYQTFIGGISIKIIKI
jgi:transcriptional regulator with PAS, ATPase and Fis domain